MKRESRQASVWPEAGERTSEAYSKNRRSELGGIDASHAFPFGNISVYPVT